jgi:excisionase family DNA binding protein
MTANAGQQTLLTIRQVAERTRVPVETIRWLRQQGRFAPAVKVGRRLAWDVAEVDAWLVAESRPAA